jgi:lipoprotein-anchoring transpeptidase ErfK/SrfK
MNIDTRLIRPPLRPLLAVSLAVPLLAPLLEGCAHQPYPPLPDDVAAPVSSTYAAPMSGAAVGTRREVSAASPTGSADLSGPGAGANVSETARREAALAPVSQEVVPPPPDPDSLPAAEKRRLDLLLGSQTFNYYEDDQLLWSGKISSGAAEHPTPVGSFRVQAKNRHKRSGSYTNYFDLATPMPYALQFLGPYWVHEGYVPNEPASHGCVRLRYEDAKFVYARIRVGDPVNVIE